MFMVLEEVLAVRITLTSPVISVHGNMTVCLSTLHHIFYRKLLLCRVTLGKPHESLSAFRMAHAPPGHHSVVGKPSPGGLSFSEFVIYRGEQVCDHVMLVVM